VSTTAAQAVTFEQVLQLAQQHQAAGRLAEACELFERLLSATPQHPTVLTMLASIAYQQGDEMLGEAYLDRALEIYAALSAAGRADPAQCAAHANLLLARRRTDEAEATLGDAALPLNPVRMTPETFAERRRVARAAGLPPILITTIPKSASESIWNRLAEGLGLAQSHVSIGLFPDCALVPHRVGLFASGGLIAKEHIRPTAHNLRLLRTHGIARIVVHLRDPRQATLSWAHFVRDDIARRPLAPIWRRIVPPPGVLRRGLEATIDWCLEHYLPLLIGFIEGWLAVARDPAAGLVVRCLTFEQFRLAPERYLSEILAFYGIERGWVALDAKAEVVHLRKGALDEWRGVFNRAQRRRAGAAIPGSLAEAFGWRP
jgi:hypothetical protein